jgi:isopentenyl-diphosphate delta-isomerase
MKKDELLDIVDENDVIIGQDTRENVHKKGLLHREVHIWFITPDGNIIFQHRAKDKDTYPDLLDATVGGHVEPGESYLDAAVKETMEETGLKLNQADLHELKKLRTRSEDKATGMINNTFRMQYLYIFRGKISDLHIEKGKAVGFEAYSIEELQKMNDADKSKFISVNYSTLMGNLLEDIKKLL